MRRGRGALEGVEHHQELHQVVVHRRAGRLDDEDVRAPDVLVDLDEDLAVREPRRPPPGRAGIPRQAAISSASARCAFPGRASARTAWLLPLLHQARCAGPLRRLDGWGGRIRTSEYGIQSPAPYRLATPQVVPVLWRRIPNPARPSARRASSAPAGDCARDPEPPRLRPQRIPDPERRRDATERCRTRSARCPTSARPGSPLRGARP